MKRGISAFLCVLLLIGALPLPAFAAGADTLYINTVSELLRLAENCVLDSWSRDKTVVLTADLDLTGAEFSGIPLFMGRFDGNGHTVSGFVLDADASTAGLFRKVLEGGVVESLTVSGVVTPGGAAVTVGGIAGENHGEIRSCAFVGTVKGVRCVGGIAGSNGETGLIERCAVSGTVAGEHRIGGVAGENLGTIRASVNRAAVNTEAAASVFPEELDPTLSAEELLDITDVGGVAGYSSGTVQACVNGGAVGYPRVGYNIGGIVGHASGYTEGCTNQGIVRGRKDVGGGVGQLDPDAKWKFSNHKLNELQQKLDELQRRVNRLSEDAGAEKSVISSDISKTLAALNRTGDAAEALTERASTVIDSLVPVSDGLEDFTKALPAAADGFAEASRAFSAAAEASEPGTDALADALGAIANAMQSAQDAAIRLSEGLGHLEKSMGEPEEVNKALEEIAKALSALGGSLTIEEGSEEDEGDTDSGLPDWRSLLDIDWDAAGEALSALAEGFSALIEQTNLDELEAAMASLRLAMNDLRSVLGDLERSAVELQTTASALSGAGTELSRGFSLLADAAEDMEDAFAALHRAVESAGSIIDDLAEQPTLSFATNGQEIRARDDLFRSLEDVNSALGSLTGRLADTALLSDVQAVSDQLFAVMEYLIATVNDSQTAGGREYVDDVSAGEETQTTGAVRGCINQAEVDADTNAGGIVGAVTIEFSFDREDEYDLSALISGGAKYVIYAVVRDCANAADITAQKAAAGGIVGRMDYGAVFDCESRGAVASSGDYAGGIAGYSRGTLLRCRARTNLGGGNYAGGVAGFGHDLFDCLAMPSFSAPAEFQGSVAGDADGTLEGNYYAESGVGGVNGFSYEGRAQSLPYNALVEKSGDGDLFRTITVTFQAEGETVAVVAVPFGGSVGTLPEIPEKDGKYWKWDAFDNRAIYRSITVEGRYISPLTTISSGEAVPLLLVEGSFYEGQTLAVIPYAAELSDDAELLAAYTLSVANYDDGMTVRIRTEEDGKLYVLGADGLLSATPYTRDGSYIVFQLDNGGSFVLARQERAGRTWIVWAAAAGGAAAAVAAIVLVRKKRDRVHNHTEAEASEQD